MSQHLLKGTRKMTPEEIAAAATIAYTVNFGDWSDEVMRTYYIENPDEAASILQTARAELAKLGEAWRTGEGAEIMDDYQHQQELLDTQCARIADLEAELARVREALEPFAKDAANWDAEENDGHVFDDDEMVDSGGSELTIGDLRRARTALKGQTHDKP